MAKLDNGFLINKINHVQLPQMKWTEITRKGNMINELTDQSTCWHLTDKALPNPVIYLLS